MNLCLFFEGTGQDGEDDVTNVTRLHGICVSSEAQILHLEGGPGTHFGAYLRGLIRGMDWQVIFRDARRWFEKRLKELGRGGEHARVFLFGFSRGAMIARHFAAWLDKLGHGVDYMGLWDTVDATPDLDVAEECPPNVVYARHAVARDEKRPLFAYVPVKANAKPYGRHKVEELVFPGVHSDVGGLYEDNHVIADASLYWIATGAIEKGLLVKDGADLVEPPADAKIVIHDSTHEMSNLWGALGENARDLAHLPRHHLCERTYGDSPHT